MMWQNCHKLNSINHLIGDVEFGIRSTRWTKFSGADILNFAAMLVGDAVVRDNYSVLPSAA